MGNIRGGTLGFHGTIGQPTAQVFDGSLQFINNSKYLTRTPSAGNRRTWTWSGWFKRDALGANDNIFKVAGSSTKATQFTIMIHNGNFISIDYGGAFYLKSDRLIRNLSGWYNFVVSVDTTRTAANSRIRLYVNGVEEIFFATRNNPNENEELGVNRNSAHTISTNDTSGFDGRFSNFYLIDGLQLGPEYFGFIDPLTNTWRPKKFRAVGTTVNDGTDWSANFSGNGGTEPSTAFDGGGPRQDGYVHSGSALTVNFSPPLSGHIIVYGGTGAGSHNPTTTDTFTLSDGSVLSSQEKYDVAPYFSKLDFGDKKNITSLVCSGGYTLYAVEVDGVFLKNDTTETLNFGTNGFYLPMDNEDDFEIDKSGKGNNWTKNGFSGTSIDPDVLKDSPSGAVFGGRAQTGITTTSSAPANYATLNPLVSHSGTISDANLSFAGGSAAWCKSVGTFQIPSSGKYYFEGIITGSGAASHGIGLAEDVAGSTESDLTTGDDYYCVVNNTSTTVNKVSNASATSLGSIGAFSQNDVFGVAVDGSTKEIWIHKNNTYFGSNTPSGTALLTGSGNLFPAIWGYNTNGSWDVNFGQKPFKYAPPQGFLPLNSASVRPETVIPHPDKYVGVTTYTGTGSLRDVDVGMQPDLVWIKRTDDTQSHIIVDVLRGSTKELNSDDNGAQGTFNRNVTAFNSNGFRVWDGNPNGTGFDFVTWTWKAGGAKGTFNVDDVGYASASDVNMNADALSNKTQDWSGNATGGQNVGRAFDGTGPRKDHYSHSASSLTVNFSPAISGHIIVYGGTGGSGHTDTFTLSDGHVLSSSVVYDTSPYYSKLDFGVKSNITSLTCSNGYTLYAIVVDGKLLVDDDVSVNVPSIPTTGCSVGTKQGFSILKYTGSGANGSIAHGLSQAPDFFFGRDLEDTGGSRDWIIYHKEIGSTGRLKFTTGETSTSSTFFRDGSPTDTWITVGTSNDINSTNDYILYCWHDVPGLQKFGKYTGNNNANGPYVELGFRPAVLMVKRTAGANANWYIMDKETQKINPVVEALEPNTSDSTNTANVVNFDFLSNGFKIRGTDGDINATNIFVYAAWAEAPAFNLYGAQSNAR